MPKRRAVWSSWNYLAANKDSAAPPCVTYWMNRLQNLPGPELFVTLNPHREPASGLIYHRRHFEHPMFDVASFKAQRDIWSLQGANRTWFCGAYLGSGVHEDGIQAGLAVAESLGAGFDEDGLHAGLAVGEALGGVRRPWNVAHESGRIHLPREMALAA